MLHLYTYTSYLLFQGRGELSEQDAVLAPHMIHLGGQAFEILLTLLAGVALLGREHFLKMISEKESICRCYHHKFRFTDIK